MSKVERVVTWTVAIVLGIPFIAMVFMLLISMTYAMYTDLVDPGVCW